MHKIGGISRTEAFRSFAVQCHAQQPAQPPISRGPPRDFQYVKYHHIGILLELVLGFTTMAIAHIIELHVAPDSTPRHSSHHPEMTQKLSGIQSSLMSTKREVVRLRQLAARQGLFDDPAAQLAQASAAIKRELGLLTQAVCVYT